MQLMRSVDRSFTARAVAAVTGIHPEDFYDLKRGYKMAAYTGGVRGMLEQGWVPESGGLTAEAADAAAAKIPTDLWVGAGPLPHGTMHSPHVCPCVHARRGSLLRGCDAAPHALCRCAAGRAVDPCNRLECEEQLLFVYLEMLIIFLGEACMGPSCTCVVD